MTLSPPTRAPLGMPVAQADLEYAIRKLEGGKDVFISNIKIEVFDLLDDEDRQRCSKVEKDVLTKVYAGSVILMADKTDKMQRSDGSTTWMRLLKWMEFDLKD